MEYEENSSPEAKVVKDFDKVNCEEPFRFLFPWGKFLGILGSLSENM